MVQEVLSMMRIIFILLYNMAYIQYPNMFKVQMNVL